MEGIHTFPAGSLKDDKKSTRWKKVHIAEEQHIQSVGNRQGQGTESRAGWGREGECLAWAAATGKGWEGSDEQAWEHSMSWQPTGLTFPCGDMLIWTLAVVLGSRRISLRSPLGSAAVHDGVETRARAGIYDLEGMWLGKMISGSRVTWVSELITSRTAGWTS